MDQTKGLSGAVRTVYERCEREDTSVAWTLLRDRDILSTDLDWVADVAALSSDEYDWHFGAILLVISTFPLGEVRAGAVAELMREVDEGSYLEGLFAIGLTNRHVDRPIVARAYAKAMQNPSLAQIAKNHPPFAV